MRQSLGTAVVAGMFGVTIFGLIFTPVFYVVTRSFGRRGRYKRLKSERAARGGLPAAAPVGAMS